MGTPEVESEKVQFFKGHHAMAVPFGGGFVRFTEARLQLIKASGDPADGVILADAAARDVTYWQPKLFMGDGVKLDMGDAGSWTVETGRNGLLALGHAKRWTQDFIAALRDAGAGPADDS